jgi:hypothetical protein
MSTQESKKVFRSSGVASSRTSILLAAAGIFMAFLMNESNAGADVAACIDAHKSGQRAKIEGHLRRAAQLFATCGADPSCPAVLRSDCNRFLDDTNRAVPTVIFAVTEDDSKDVTDVKVFVDQELIASSLNGRPLEIDPGPRHIRLVLPRGPEVTQDVLIRESEKDRLIRVNVQSPRPASPPALPPATPAPAPLPPARPIPVVAWVAASGAVVALATGLTLGAMGASKQSELDQCKPACSPSMRGTYDSAKSLYLAADISFGVAAVAAGVATWLFLARPGSEAQTSAAERQRVVIGLTPAPRGGSIVVQSAF